MAAVRRSRRSTRWVAIALVALAAQAVALFHDAWIRHARCAAHGEVIHADADPTSGHTPDARRDPDGPAGVRTSDRDARHPADHDHCQPVVARRQAAAETLASTALPPLQVGAAPVVAPPPARAQRYRLAPKTSPPARS